ncbi:uncharacterized protein LOC133876697 [Alnus glutinosa]|uniref:uncharacterized protein LOC133876697 n=1 Tax=Alnus glutinosa TaxID=3517 RepID=UPI002D783459|nr:uncharacterized protein LOC133876697 [Alnus glutinosa]
MGCIGIGIIARDCYDCFLGACSFSQQLVVDPKGAEAIAALNALLFSKEAVGFFDIILEGDALQIVKKVNSNSSSMHSSGHFIEGIKEELGTFRSFSVVHVRREENFATHTLARDATISSNDLSWLDRRHSYKYL